MQPNESGESAIAAPVPDRPLTFRQRFKQLPTEKKVMAYIGAGAVGVLIGVLPYAGTLLSANKYIEGNDGMLTPEAMVSGTTPVRPLETKPTGLYGGYIPTEPKTGNFSADIQPSAALLESPAEFTNRPYRDRLSAAIPFLQANRAESLAAYYDATARNMGMEFPKPDELEVEPRIKIAQKIIDNIRADLLTASKQTNPNVKQNLLNAIYNPNDDVSKTLISSLDTPQDELVNDLKYLFVTDSSDFYDNGNFGGKTEADGNPTMRIKIGATEFNNEIELVVKRYTDSVSGVEQDVNYCTYFNDSPLFNTGPESTWSPTG